MKKFIVSAAVVFGAFAFAVTANAAFTWTPNQALIKVGSRGAQVMDLQACLAELSYNPNSNIDGIFGNITKSAVMSFQASKGVAVDGIIGNVTGPLYEAACSDTDGGTGSTGGTTDTSDFPTTGGEEASLEDLKVKRGDESTIAEGEEEEIAVIEFDVEDGDVMIERLDLSFVFEGTSGEDEPWDAFETITLMADGDEIASEAVDDEDDWLSEDEPFKFRFNGLNYVVEEGDTAKISVVIEAQSSVDDSDVNGANDWAVYVGKDGIRGIDTAGLTQYLGSTNEAVLGAPNTYVGVEYREFSIEDEAAGEDITIRSSSDDLDAMMLKVDENDVSDEHEIFVFELEADERDIDLEELTLEVQIGTADFENVVNDIWIEIDGEMFDDYDGTNEDSDTATLVFDINGDFTVDGDERVDVVVFVEFKKQDTNYLNGETILVETIEVTGEGVDDVDDNTNISSSLHTLNISPADITDFAWETNNAGTILDFSFTLEAGDDEDFDIVLADIAQTLVTDTTSGVGAPVLTVSGGTASHYVVNGANNFTVKSGKEVTFRLRYSVTAPVVADNGTYFEAKVQNVAGTVVPTNRQSKTSTVTGL